MKKLISLFFALLLTSVFSQNTVRITDQKTGKNIYNAAVYCDDDLLGKTNTEGVLNFKTKCRQIEIIAKNYEDRVAAVQKDMRVVLQPSNEKSDHIEKIVIQDKSDPRALKMLDELEKRAKENSPKSLDAYEFVSYTKISMDVEQDSLESYRKFLERRQDSLANAPRNLKQKEKEVKDSLIGEEFLESAKTAKKFLWEKASRHQFSKSYGEKTTILDTRISGLKNPLYEAMALNVSSLNRTPRQLRPENRKLFHYYLSDTLQLDGRTTYVIKFKEITDKKRQNPRKFNGKIYVDAENFALKKFESQSRKTNEGNITSVWKPIGKKWFLDHEDLQLFVGRESFETGKSDSITKGKPQKMKYKSFKNFVYIKNRFFDFKINEDQQAEDFKGYSLEVEKADGSVLEKYRTDSLSAREQATYVQLDSFVEKNNFEKRLDFLSQLVRGNLRYKMIDFDLTKIIRINAYEGLRLGLGVKLNEKFSTVFSPDGYFGYGFKDRHWKYGVGLDVKLSRKRTSVFRLEYSDDVFAAGRFSTHLWDQMMKMKNNNLDWYNANFYRSKKFSTSYLYDISNSLTVKTALNFESQESLFMYRYQNFTQTFKNSNATISVKFAPNDKNVMTPSGKYNFEKKFPQIFANIELGTDILGANTEYMRADAVIFHQFKTKLGVSDLKIYGGISSGTAPVWKKFEIAGQRRQILERWNSNLSAISNLGFATMPSGTFYAEQMAGFGITQTLPLRFRTLGKRLSSISLQYHAAAGNFKNASDHHFPFRPLDHLYQESGIIWNSFLGTRYNLGFSYRLGHYQTDDFKENYGIQISYNLFN